MFIKYRRWWVIAGLFLMPVVTLAQETNKASLNIVPLHSIHSNNTFRLKQLDSTLIAIVFLSPECPISQNYTLTLNRIQKDFSRKLTVIGIFPGTYFKNAAYLAFEKKYHITFKLLKDENKLLAQTLGAATTPQVFLLNAHRQVVYSGAIDDWAVSLGKMRKAASEHYLKNAVEHTLVGLPAEPIKTKAVGCFIN